MYVVISVLSVLNLAHMRAIWKVTSGELLTNQALRTEKCIIYEKYVRTYPTSQHSHHWN
jgi:hypothetical protein